MLKPEGTSLPGPLEDWHQDEGLRGAVELVWRPLSATAPAAAGAHATGTSLAGGRAAAGGSLVELRADRLELRGAKKGADGRMLCSSLNHEL